MSIKVKLLILFLCVALVPMAFAGMLGFVNAKNIILSSTVARLSAIAELRESQVYIYIDRLKAVSREMAMDGFFSRALQRLEGESGAAAQIQQELHSYLLKKITGAEALSVDLLDRRGKVVASSVPARAGRDLSGESCYWKALVLEEWVRDFHLEESDQRMMDISIPITAPEDPYQMVGVFVAHYDSKIFNRLLLGDLVFGMGAKTQSRGIGATGETFLANQDGRMVTESIFIKDAPFNQKVNTYASRKCFNENKEVSGTWKDYRGVEIVGASMCLSIGDFRWMILAKQDTREAFAPIRELYRLSVAMGVVVLVIVGVVGLAIADFITGPVIELTRMTQRAANGEGGVHTALWNTHDEIDILGRSLNGMMDNLHRAGEEMRLEVNIRKESEEKFRGLVEAAPDAVISINPAGEIILVNAQAERMFGYSRVEMIGKMVEILMPQRFRDRHVRHREEYFKKPSMAVAGTGGGLFGLRKSGEEFPIEISLSFARFSEKIFAISTIRDISRRVKTEQELIEKTQRLQRFQNLTVGRELEMIALKKEINSLLTELGRPKKFEAPGKAGGGAKA